MKNRAIRRHHKARMKDKARMVAFNSWGACMEQNPDKLEKRLKKAEQYADNLQPCSCWGCGNPRRHFKGEEHYTRQELKARDSFKDDL